MAVLGLQELGDTPGDSREPAVSMERQRLGGLGHAQ